MPDSTFDPTRRRLIGAAAATFLLSVSKLGFAGNSQVVAIRIWPASSYTRITLEASDAIKFKQFTISNPDRLVIDLEGVQLNSVLKDISSQIADADPYIKTARAGQFSPDTVRLVLELKTDVKPQAFTLSPVAEYKHRLVVDLYPASGTQDDPLMALLDDYNKGKLTEPPPQVKPKKNDANRPIVVMLDPGHGGEDPGAIGMNGTREKDIVLRIGKQLKRMIDAERNMKAFMTREEDIFIPLGVRVAKARKLNADLFISIHADAAPNRSARGSSVFALSEKGASSAFAKTMAQSENSSDLIGGVKIAIQAPGQASKTEGKVEGKLILTSKSDQEVVSISVKIFEEFTTGRGDDKKTSKYELGIVKITPGFTIKAGETKAVDFSLPFSVLKSSNDELKEKGGAMGAIGKLGAFASNEKSEYFVEADVDVKSAALDPSDKKQIKLV